MIGELERHLRDNWSIMFPQKVNPKRLSFLEAKGFRKTIFFVFVDKDKSPSVIIKITNKPKIVERLKRECENLDRFQGLGLFHLIGTLPRRLFWGTINGYAVLMETVIPGRSIACLARKNTGKHIYLASRWLLEFHCATKSKEESIDLMADFQYPIEKFQSSVKLSQEQRSFLKRIVEEAGMSKGVKLPLVFRHYDFTPENILVSKSVVGVVDWEYARFPELPLVDLFHFLVRYQSRESILKTKIRLSLSSAMKRKVKGTRPSIDDFRKTFFMPTDFSNLAKEAICCYCSGLNIDGALAKLFLVRYIIEQGDFDWFLLLMEKENDLVFG